MANTNTNTTTAMMTNGSINGGDSSKRAIAPSPSSAGGGGGGGGGLSFAALFFMACLSVQFGIQPIVTKRYTPPEVNRSTVVFAQEFVKLAIGVVGINLTGTGSKGKGGGGGGWAHVTKGWTVSSWLRLALLPAFIYLVQNMCSLLAYQNLDAITYNVLNQTKTLSAALCCYLLMGKRQSSMQVLALLLLLAAALVMEGVLPMDALMPSYWMGGAGGGDGAAEDDDDDEAMIASSSSSQLSPRHLSHGVLPIMVASFLSGLAGAITQKSLQTGNRHALLFTVELCVASLLLLLGSFVASDDGRRVRERGFFDGWTLLTIVPVLTNSAGGILVGLVIKHAGTVRKGFALIFGILLSGMVQSAMDEDKALSREEVAGGVLAAVSLWMHATNPYVARKKDKEKVATRMTQNGTVRPARRGRGRKED